jgi:NAD(P)-dependent dehydrogenase (short-subunit alcohol dehydrogenase family)
MPAEFTQITDLPMAMTPELARNKTYIVTGSNGGLGFEAVKHLVSMGAATVVMAVRTLTKGETAKAEIEAATGRKEVIKVWQLDKTSFDSVKAFAQRAIDELDHVDALIDNAGVAQSSPAMPEGHTENMTVNTYSSLLLAVLFLPSMSSYAKKSGTTPHIVLVSSGASFRMGDSWNKVKDDDPLQKMDDVNVFGPLQTYVLHGSV